MKTKEKSCKELINQKLEGRAADFIAFMNADDLEENTVNKDGYEVGSFYSYGLAFSFVEPYAQDGEHMAGYFRYQLSWGGPSDEVRFYQDGGIEYWYMDWFDGAKIDIKDLDWAKWLEEMFDIENEFFN